MPPSWPTNLVLPTKMLVFNSHMLKNTCYCNLKWTFKDLLLCYWHATKTNCKTICWQVSQFASASKMCELQLNTASHLNLCSVSVIQTNKLLLEESNHIIEIKLLALGFLQMFGSYFQFPGKDNCLFFPITLLQEDYGRKVQGLGAISNKCVKNRWFWDNYRGWHPGLDTCFLVIIRRFRHCKTTFLSLLGYGLWAHKLKSVKSKFEN